jgi:hypothetical protein
VTLLHVDADADLGVPSRVLDLLVAQDRLPEAFNLLRDGARMTLRMRFIDLPADRAALMVAKIRQIPGVRAAAPLEMAAST